MKNSWILLIISLLSTSPLSALDWPQLRGPDRSGVALEQGLAGSWPASGPPVVWTNSDLGEGYGAVAVVGDRIYVQGTRQKKSMVFAIDGTNGRTLWATELGPRLVQDKGNGPRSTPTVVDGVLYVLNGMGELAAIDAESGEVRWQFNMLDRFSSRNIRWGISESPLVDGDRLYIMPGGKQGSIVALDRSNGETVWTSKGLTDGASYSSLIAADIGTTRAIIGFTQEAGVGVRADNGDLLWRYEAPANKTANAATPIFADNQVFYTSSYGVGGGALKLEPSTDGIESSEAYFEGRFQNHHGGAVLYEGHLYSFFGPALACVDFRTGEVKWRARSVGKGSLTIADGKLYLLGERHVVGLAVASPEGYRELGRFEIEDHGWPSWAYPVVDGGRLYIRNQQDLTAYDIAK